MLLLNDIKTYIERSFSIALVFLKKKILGLLYILSKIPNMNKLLEEQLSLDISTPTSLAYSQGCIYAGRTKPNTQMIPQSDVSRFLTNR